MKKNKRFYFAAMAMVLSVSIASYTGYRQWEASAMPQCDLFTVENAMAIGETMPNYYTMSDCQAHMGVWGMFSKNVDGGTNSVTCEIEGEVSVAGVSIKGSYRKGKSYTISWSRYSCEKAEGNCCVIQGVIIGG